MLFFFYFIGLILSISKDEIKHTLNTTVGLCIVYPDNSIFDITKNNLFQTLMNMIQGRFSLSTYSYSQYSLSDKSTLSKHSNNIIITRDNKFLEHYTGNLSISSIAEEINQAFYSYVEILNESTLSQFKEDTHSLFLLTGPSIIKEYEDAAFFYKHTKAKFGFLYQNITNDTNSSNSFVSLYYIKNKYNVSRIYDKSIPMIQFIRSCKIEKSSKSSQQNAQAQSRYQKHSAQFVAITNNFTEEIQSAFDYLNNTNYRDIIDFDVVSWENATELEKMCQIKKPESNLTFVLYPKLRKRQYVECNVFQDMDFYSKELLYFFVSKSLKGWSLDQRSMKSNNFGMPGSSNIFMMNTSPMSLTQSSFSNFIPGRNLALVFIECPDSFSLFEAKLIFNSLRHEFNEIKINGDKNGRYLRPVDFYKIEYYVDSYKLPSADAFPTFAIFEPYNKLANVFNEILTIENLRNWIIKFASKEYDDEMPNSEEKQSNPIINDFSTFIKELSFGSAGRQINKNENPQISPKPTQISPETESSPSVSDSNKEKEDTIDDSNSPLKSLLSSFGFNFNFDDIKEIKIISDIDMIDSNSEESLDENKNTDDSNLNKKEIEELVGKIVKKEVKNLFDKEKAQLKNEIINEVLENIENKQNSSKRTKIINTETPNNENEVNERTEKTNQKIDSTEKVPKREVTNEVKNDNQENSTTNTIKTETTNNSSKKVLEQEIKNKETKESNDKSINQDMKKEYNKKDLNTDKKETDNKENTPEQNDDEEKTSSRKKLINDEHIFDLEESSEDEL